MQQTVIGIGVYGVGVFRQGKLVMRSQVEGYKRLAKTFARKILFVGTEKHHTFKVERTRFRQT